MIMYNTKISLRQNQREAIRRMVVHTGYLDISVSTMSLVLSNGITVGQGWYWQTPPTALECHSYDEVLLNLPKSTLVWENVREVVRRGMAVAKQYRCPVLVTGKSVVVKRTDVNYVNAFHYKIPILRPYPVLPNFVMDKV